MGIGHQGFVVGLGDDAVFALLEDAVAAVDAAAHDEVDDHGVLAGLVNTQADAAAGIGVGIQQCVEIKGLHLYILLGEHPQYQSIKEASTSLVTKALPLGELSASAD